MAYVLVARCTDEQTWIHRQRLEALYDAGRDIKGVSFFKHVCMKDVAELLGYAYGRWQRGVRLLKDWHLQFHRSTWRGVPCYHMEWSGIDHIFVHTDHVDKMTDRKLLD